MADASLDHSASALNLNISNFDKLSERLKQAYAMAIVATSEHFPSHNEFIIHNYFWVLSELLVDAQDAFEGLELFGKGDQQTTLATDKAS